MYIWYLDHAQRGDPYMTAIGTSFASLISNHGRTIPNLVTLYLWDIPTQEKAILHFEEETLCMSLRGILNRYSDTNCWYSIWSFLCMVRLHVEYFWKWLEIYFQRRLETRVNVSWARAGGVSVFYCGWKECPPQ